jgi:transcription elongation GreA/GreB family factor
VIRLGSVVQTNQLNYFVACGVGKIEVDNQVYYAISPKAPVGQILLGKTAKETILFRGNTLQIEAVF